MEPYLQPFSTTSVFVCRDADETAHRGSSYAGIAAVGKLVYSYENPRSWSPPGPENACTYPFAFTCIFPSKIQGGWSPFVFWL